MPKILRRDAILLMASSYYRKKTSAVWELDNKPKEQDFVFYYEDIRPDVCIH